MSKTFYTDCHVHRGKILYRGYRNGKRIQDKFNYEPYLFLPSKKDNGYYTLNGDYVKKVDFPSIWEARKFVADHSNIDGFKYYGITNFEYLYIADEFKNEIAFDRSLLSIVSLDIENKIGEGEIDVRNAPNEITAITLRKNGVAYIFGTKYYKVKEDNVNYYLCEDEAELLYKFLDKWQELDPDVVIGWNVEIYDIPYIINRITNILSFEAACRLSPWFLLESKEVEGKFGEIHQVWNMIGLVVLDYMRLYKKFSFKNQESYSLDYISFVELEEKKLDYRSEGYHNLDDLYEKNFELYIDYNLRDVLLVDRLDSKLGYLNVVFSLAYLYKCNYEDTFATVKPWDVCIHHTLMSSNIVVPMLQIPENENTFEGGFVKDTEPGRYEWIISVDIKSSYPHQIMSYNMSPETFIKRLSKLTVDEIIDGKLEQFRETINKHNLSVSGNMCVFRKDTKGFMADIMESFFNKRAIFQNELEALEKETSGKDIDLDTKNHMASLDGMQMALKIAINAFYGMLSNKYCRWYSLDLSESVTLSGQLAVKWAAKRINTYLNKVFGTKDVDYWIGGDTDSCYFTLKPLVKKLGLSDKKEIAKAIEKFYNGYLDKVIKDGFEDLHLYTNSYQNKIRMARENIADVAIWTGRKHYALNVVNSKGVMYDKPKLKTVGLETNRSSTPMIVRNYLKKSIDLIINTDQDTVINYINEVKKDFFSRSFAEIATPSSANNLKKYSSSLTIYTKGAPWHVKGALLYNDYIKKNKLDNKLMSIKPADKIRCCSLILPNPLYDKVISVPDELPTELKLDKYIDYQTQFEKAYLKPITTILNSIGWESEKKASLDSIFSFDF